MKKKPADTAPLELAAPAVLRRLQVDAAKFSNQIDDCESRVAALRELSPNAADTQKEEIARTECELITARDNFGKTAKILLSYDRGIDSNRKEGEKISVEEAKEIWKQFVLSLRLAMEQQILACAQSAALCDSPESFHIAASGNWRAALTGAIDSAITEGVIPKWLAQ